MFNAFPQHLFPHYNRTTVIVQNFNVLMSELYVNFLLNHGTLS